MGLLRRPEDLLASPWRFLLLPAWCLSRPLIGLRGLAYDLGWKPTFRVGVPVISVGNLAAGGTGKTPCCQLVVERLHHLGRNPAVLMRGYKGQDGTNEEAALYGVPVVSDPDRVAGANRARAAGADCLVLDDGFQHRRLGRDLDIVLIDALRPWGGGAVLPLGLLREPASALRRADLIILSRSDQIDDDARTALTARLAVHGKPVLAARHAPLGLRSLAGGDLRPPDLSGVDVVLVSGIGNPAAFAATVTSLGARIAGDLRFPDHHHYGDADLETIRQASRRGRLLTTTKDAVKLRGQALEGDSLEVGMALAGTDLARLDAALATVVGP